MASDLKKVKKSGILEAGEQAAGVLFVQPTGVIARTAGGAAGGLVGTLAGEALGRRREKQAEEDAQEAGDVTDAGLAVQVPIGAQSYLVLTDRRWVVASHAQLSGKPKDVVGTWERGDITAIEFHKGKLASRAKFTFRDGTVARLDAPRGKKADEFAQAATAAGVEITFA